MDIVTLAMAQPNIIDLSKYPTHGGVVDGMSLNDQMLYMCQQSVDKGGAVQSAELTLDDDSFRKTCGLKGHAILKLSVGDGNGLIDVYFPATVSIIRSTSKCSNLHASATLYLDGLFTVECCIVFSNNTHGLYMTIKATMLT